MAAIVSLQELSEISDKGGKDALAKAFLKNLGDQTQYKVTKNYVLVGLFIGGNRIAGSTLLRAHDNVKNDVFQSNCGLIIKMGPSAFKQNDGKDEPDCPKIGQWIYYRGGHQRLQINGINYAFLHEDDVVGAVPDPALITHRNA